MQSGKALAEDFGVAAGNTGGADLPRSRWRNAGRLRSDSDDSVRDVWRLRVRLISSMSLIFLGSFTATALAAETVDGDLIDVARPVLDAILAGQYTAAAALGLVLAVALLRRYGSRALPWLHSDVGGAVLALGTSLGGALATALMAGASLSGGLLWTALGVAIAAAGGYAMIKKLIIVPLLRPLRDRAPAWLRAPLDLILWIFDRPDPIAVAVAAGDAAVTADPPSGVIGIVGEPRDIN